MAHSASSERWRRVQRLFAEVVGLAPERRAARLHQACQDDPRLREGVEALLDRHEAGELLRGDPEGPRHTEPPSPAQRETPSLEEEPPSAWAPGKDSPAERPPSDDHPPDGRQAGDRSDKQPQGELIAGRYVPVAELGRGAMGVVYKARDTRLGRFVALKFLSPHLGTDRRARARLSAEAQAVSALDHPHICTLYEVDETDDARLFLVMAYYDGETLERLIDRGPLSLADAVRITTALARGLEVAHRHGVVHRDVKPSNVLVTDEGVAKLLDFGIAKVSGSTLTRTGDTLGTVEYMSPDQLRGEVDARTDVWALGVVLYEMLTGERPFRGDYEAALLYAILDEEPPPLAQLRNGVPEALAEVVRRCLEKDPEKRYPSAEAVAVDLGRVDEGEARPPFRLPFRPSSRRSRRLALGLCSILLPLAFLVTPFRTAAINWLGLGGGSDVQHLALLPLVSPTDEASVGMGLTYTLTSMLTQLGPHAEPAFTVVPADAMWEIATTASARARFGVGVVVSGDFRQGPGERAHLTLNLVDARSLRQLHTKRLTGRLPEIRQQALAALADMLDVDVSADERARLTAGETGSERAVDFYLRGVDLLKRFDHSENVDATVQLFQWALQDDSLYALAHAGLVEAYMWKYRVTKEPEWISRAEYHGDRALELDDRLAAVRTALGNLYKLTGNREAAIREFRLALSLDPHSAEAYYGLAATYRALQSPGEAERYYLKSIALRPGDWRPYNDLGLFYIESGRYEEAESQFEHVTALAPDNEMGYEGLGTSFLYRGDLENAGLWLERALKVKPTYSTYSNLGYIYSQQERYEEEAQAYERALELDDSDYLVWGNLGSVSARIGGRNEASERAYQRAIDLIDRQLRVSPSDPILLSDLASYHLELGRSDLAEDALERVSISVSSDADLAHRVAVMHERLGQRDRALLWVREALARGLPRDKVQADPALRNLRDDVRYAQLTTSFEETAPR